MKINFKKCLIIILTIMLSISLIACNNYNSNKTQNNDNVSENTIDKATDNVDTKYPITIKDSTGKEITIEKEPEKVVSLAPNATEIIFALGKGDKLAGRTDYCTYPEDAKKVQSVGDLMNINYEKLMEIQPDIVITSPMTLEETRKKIADLGIKVLVIDNTQSFDATYNIIEQIGKMLNANQKSSEIVSSMKEKVESVKKKVAGADKLKVYYLVSYGESGDYTAGKGTFIDSMTEIAGGVNIANDVDSWSKYSVEKIIEKDPDIIIYSESPDNPINNKESIMAANGYKDIKAVKEGKVMPIDSDLVEIQGPRLADGLEALAKIIHPELYK